MTLTIAAVVFDLDGVLVDSEPAQIAAWNAVLARYGCALDDVVVRELFGLRVRDSARRLVERFGLPCEPAALLAEREAVFFERFVDHIPLVPDAAETLAALRAAGVPLALATSGHRRYVERLLPRLVCHAPFTVVVTGDDVERGKPAPDCYQLAVQRLGVAAAQALAVEDAPLGVAAAKAAGLPCVAVPNHYTAGLPGLEAADACVPQLRAVLPWLAERGWPALVSRGERR